MAMDKDTLGALIVSKINSLTASEKKTDLKVWTAVGEAIIDHIKSSAEINPLSQSGIIIAGSATITAQGQTVKAGGKIE
jgi:hypothetical protein